MGDTVGIKYINNIYVVSKDGKYNIYVVAVTTEDRKIGSGIYCTKEDLKNLFDAIELSEKVNKIRFECTLESGANILIYKTNVPLSESPIPIYEIKIDRGESPNRVTEFFSRMTERSLDEFFYSIKQNYNALNDSTIDMNLIYQRERRRLRKLLKRIVLSHLRSILIREERERLERRKEYSTDEYKY